MYEIKEELRQTRSSLSNESKLFHHAQVNFVDIFKALNVLNLIFQGKNIGRINDCDAKKVFAAKSKLGIVEFKKEMHLPFLN